MTKKRDPGSSTPSSSNPISPKTMFKVVCTIHQKSPSGLVSGCLPRVSSVLQEALGKPNDLERGKKVLIPDTLPLSALEDN